MFAAKLMIKDEAMEASDASTFERFDPLTGDVAGLSATTGVNLSADGGRETSINAEVLGFQFIRSGSPS